MEKLLLIVDDSKEIIEVIENIVGNLFDRVISVSNVDEAKEKICDHKFSLVILDVKVEDRNGAEVIKFLNDHPENQNSLYPIFILSGIINAEFAEKFSDRFAAIMLKPFEHEHFFSKVKDIIEAPFFDIEKEIEVSCELPFPLPELDQKVKKVLEGVKKSTRLKQLFAEIQVDRSDDNYIMSHVGVLINISTAICTKMEWNTDKTLEKFVYAAYLHDMALASRPDLARVHGSVFELELIQDQLSAADHKLVTEHPLIAANKIDDLDEIPPDVGTIVRQHHELPKENGFPSKLSHSKITPLATVFIVAHDLTHYILENPKWTVAEYVAKGKVKFKGPHFAKVLSALSEMT